MSNIYLKVKKSTILKEGDKFDLKPGENTLGRRQEDNHIVIAENGISRKHSVIFLAADFTSIAIEDLNSGNGTYVNNKKITSRTNLKHGDIIHIGSTSFELHSISPVKKADNIKTPDINAKKNTKERSPNIKSILIFLIAMISGFITYNFMSNDKTDLSKPDLNCSQQYVMADVGCKFQHPLGWKRLDKYNSNSFGYTFFESTVLFFGTKFNEQDVIFIVDTLDGVPSNLSVKDLVQTNSKEFPRVLPHGTNYIIKKMADIAGHKGFICETPSFTIGGKQMKAIEAFFIDQGRRFLLVCFASEENFNIYNSTFKKIIESFQLIPWERKLAKPEDVNAEVRSIFKNAQALVEKRNIKESNLYLSLKEFQKAAMLLNLYDFQADDQFRLKVIDDFKAANQLLDDMYADLKFQLEKGIRLKQIELIYSAAKKIVNYIPDPDDPRHQYALKYYKQYKSKFEIRNYN